MNGYDAYSLWRTLSYSVFHFLIDLACIFLLTAFLIPVLPDRASWIWCVLMYNLTAFALQLPIGALADSLNMRETAAALGACLIGGSFFIISIPLAAAVTAGIGNAFFHIGGGISVLEVSRKKAALSGIYVSTGALGVWLAPKLASKGLGLYRGASFTASLIMAVCAILMMCMYFYRNRQQTKEKKNKTRNGDARRFPQCGWKPAGEDQSTNELAADRRALQLMILCLALTVCMRSYAGTIMNFAWRAEEMTGLLFVLGVVCGKMAGGIVGDRFGWKETAVTSLCLSAVLLSFAGMSPLWGIAGVFLFNMTMPVTLTALSNILEGHYGFAFGITTFSLFIGILPSIFGAGGTLFLPQRAELFGTALLSAIVLFIGLRRYDRAEAERTDEQTRKKAAL